MNPSPQKHPTGPVLGEALLHPVALGAIGLLVLNDHFLKANYPGMLTGKLSDISGLIYFPLLLWTLADGLCRVFRGTALLRLSHLVFCIAVTGVAFVLVKTTDFGAEGYRRGWAVLEWPLRALAAGRIVPVGLARHVADPTDLLALPGLLVAYFIGRSVWSKTQAAKEPSVEGERAQY